MKRKIVIISVIAIIFTTLEERDLSTGRCGTWREHYDKEMSV